MSHRVRLLCSLPMIALTLLAAGPARGAADSPDAPSKLIEVKGAGHATLQFDPPADQGWTFVWNDVGVSEGEMPLLTTGHVQSFARVNLPAPQRPPIIAAPLPPALLSGLIGLAGVYVYKRRRGLR